MKKLSFLLVLFIGFKVSAQLPILSSFGKVVDTSVILFNVDAAIGLKINTATAATTYEPIITANNTAKYYFNGYKKFAATSTDSVTEGTTNLYFTTARAQAAVVAGGSNSQIQFNSSSSFAGSSKFTWDNTNNALLLGNGATSFLSQIYSRSVGTSDGLVFTVGNNTKKLYFNDDGTVTFPAAINLGTTLVFGNGYADFQRTSSSALGRFTFSTSSTHDYYIGYRGANNILYFDGQSTSTGYYFGQTISGVPNDVSALLQVISTTKGFLMPQMTTTQKSAIATPGTGLQAYDLSLKTPAWYNGTAWVASPTISTGIAAPTTTPTKIGDQYTDSTNKNLYFATGTTSSTGWTLANGTSTGSSTSSAVPSSSVVSGTEISTTSTTDVVATGLTLTPATAGTYAVYFNSQFAVVSGSQTAQAVTDLATAYTYLNGLTVTNSTHASAFGGETLYAGVYSIPAAGSAAGNLVLDAQNNSAAVFVLKFGAAFNTGAGTTVSLANGALASNIYWVAEGAIGLGATTTMQGTLLAHGAAVSLGSACILNGRMLSTTGAIGIDGSTINTPAASTSCNLGSAAGFAIFTSSGGVTNANASTVTGNIGTNSGTITGFGSATVTGTQYTSGTAGFATITWSIYNNGVLVPYSSRIRTSTSSQDIDLHAITTITAGQAIDIRWNTNLGTAKMENRTFTLIKVTNSN